MPSCAADPCRLNRVSRAGIWTLRRASAAASDGPTSRSTLSTFAATHCARSTTRARGSPAGERPDSSATRSCAKTEQRDNSSSSMPGRYELGSGLRLASDPPIRDASATSRNPVGVVVEKVSVPMALFFIDCRSNAFNQRLRNPVRTLIPHNAAKFALKVSS